MAQNDPKNQAGTQDQGKSKSKKSGRLTEYLIVAFVMVGTLLVLVEMGTNGANEWESRRANEISAPSPQPTAAATLTPAELQKILQENKQTN